MSLRRIRSVFRGEKFILMVYQSFQTSEQKFSARVAVSHLCYVYVAPDLSPNAKTYSLNGTCA